MNRDRKMIQVLAYDFSQGMLTYGSNQSTTAAEKGECRGRIGSRASR
jgi:hypothetical protein